MDRRRLAVVVPAVLAVALAGVIVVEVLALTGDDDALPRAPDRTLAVVGDFASAVTSFDYRHVDDDIERVLAFGTDDFEADFRAAMGDDFVERIVANQRTSTGRVIAGPTVHRVEAGRATLLVVVDQRVTSEGTGEQPQQVRVGLLVTAETDADPLVTGVTVL